MLIFVMVVHKSVSVNRNGGENLRKLTSFGTTEYVTEGALVDTFKQMVEAMFKGAATAKGALIITPNETIVTTPGADNKTVI